ncbi:unnamed protein product [Auanema sp. JU1783]|nr:unnamed protein product [Auanema sp. JU1783]
MSPDYGRCNVVTCVIAPLSPSPIIDFGPRLGYFHDDDSEFLDKWDVNELALVKERLFEQVVSHEPIQTICGGISCQMTRALGKQELASSSAYLHTDFWYIGGATVSPEHKDFRTD